MTRVRGAARRARDAAALPAGVIAHDRTVEARTKSQRAVYGPRPTYDVWRYVCSCGWSTRWHRDVAAASKQADAHAVAGQLGLDLGAGDAGA